MMPRPSRVWAVSAREWRNELKGRRALSIPGLLVALLLPASMLPTANLEPPTVAVTGDVPDEVLALPRVLEGERFDALRFESGESVLEVAGPALPDDVRSTLDAHRPKGATQIVRLEPTSQLPRRGLLLALLSGSGLTASIATSIGSERSRKTLGTLLSAAISPLELVLGKWFAWASLATATTLAFAAVALYRDVLDPGWWLLPMAITPSAMVALGLWSVRGAPDVVSATATALRVMPTATMITGVAAASLGETSFLGALVPFGGAIVMAGEIWLAHPLRDALLSTSSTSIATAVLLWHTAHTLRELPAPPASQRGWPAVPAAATLSMLALASPMLLPSLWGLGGMSIVVAHLSVDFGAAMAALTLWFGVSILYLQHTGTDPFVAARRPKTKWLITAVLVGLLLAAGEPSFTSRFDPMSQLGALGLGSHANLTLDGLSIPMGLFLLATEEFVFRGVLAQRMGHAPAAVVWGIARAPLDPLGAMVSSTALGVLGKNAGWWASLVARLVWFAALSLM